MLRLSSYFYPGADRKRRVEAPHKCVLSFGIRYARIVVLSRLFRRYISLFAGRNLKYYSLPHGPYIHILRGLRGFESLSNSTRKI